MILAGAIYFFGKPKNAFLSANELQKLVENSTDFTTLKKIVFSTDMEKLSQDISGTDVLLPTKTPSGFQINNNIKIFSRELIRIDTEQIYTMELKFKVNDINAFNDSKVTMKIGFVTYDANQKLQMPTKDLHRFFVNAGRVVLDQNTDNVFFLKGVIAGEKSASHHSFREDTKYVQPVLIVKMVSENAEFFLQTLTIKQLK